MEAQMITSVSMDWRDEEADVDVWMEDKARAEQGLREAVTEYLTYFSVRDMLRFITNTL